jgi:hypothetical protein
MLATKSRKEKKIVCGTEDEISALLCKNLRIDEGGLRIVVTDGHQSPKFIKIEKKSLCICGEWAKLLCAKCRGKKYCKKECQKADWMNHKLVCAPK